MKPECDGVNQDTLKVEELLDKYGTIQVAPEGYSMYPVIVPGRDQVILKKIHSTELKRGKVVLFRRKDGTLVLHRICKVTKDGFYLVGDNQIQVEGPIHEKQIKAVLVGMVREGKKISVSASFYSMLMHIWLVLLPVRAQIKAIAVKVNRCLRNTK